MNKPYSILLLVFTSILFYNCNQKSKFQDEVYENNRDLYSYLKKVEIDTFAYDSEKYPGVLYVFSGSINDSIFIFMSPSQCVFDEEDTTKMFYYDNKVIIFRGEQLSADLINELELMPDEVNSYKLCKSIGELNIYDPKSYLLYVDENNRITEMPHSESKFAILVFGSELPPAP